MNRRQDEVSRKLGDTQFDLSKTKLDQYTPGDGKGKDIPAPDTKKRKPSKATKILLASTAKYLGKSSLKTMASILKSYFPHTTVAIQELSGGIQEINRMRQDMMKRMNPELKSMRRTTRRLIPRVERYLPADLRQKLKAATEGWDDPEDLRNKRRSLSEEDRRDSEVAAAIDAAMMRQSVLTKTYADEDRTDKQLDRLIRSSQHAQTYSALRSIDTTLMGISSFNRQIHLEFLKKGLELKYKHLYTAMDTLELLKKSMPLFEIKLEEIKHNTGLPDYLKQRGVEKMVKEKWLGYGQEVGKYFWNTRVKLAQLAADKLVGGVKSMAQAGETLADAADLQSSIEELDPSQKKTAKEKLAGLLGMGGGSLFGKIATSKLGRKLFKGAGGKVQNFDANFANIKERAALGMENVKARLVEKGGFLGEIATVLFPNLDATFAIKDEVQSGTSGVGWDNASRKSLVEIIPGYLSRILKTQQDMTYGGDHERLVFSPDRNTFIPKSQFREDTLARALGTEENRLSDIATAGGVMMRAAENRGIDPKEFEEYADDVTRVLTNHVIRRIGIDATAMKSISEGTGLETRSYRTKAFDGIDEKDIPIVATIFTVAMHDENGMVSSRAVSMINQYVIRETKRNVYKTVFGELLSSYGHRDLFQDLFDEAGTLKKGALAERYMDAMRDEERRKAVLERMARGYRAYQQVEDSDDIEPGMGIYGGLGKQEQGAVNKMVGKVLDKAMNITSLVQTKLGRLSIHSDRDPGEPGWFKRQGNKILSEAERMRLRKRRAEIKQREEEAARLEKERYELEQPVSQVVSERTAGGPSVQSDSSYQGTGAWSHGTTERITAKLDSVLTYMKQTRAEDNQRRLDEAGKDKTSEFWKKFVAKKHEDDEKIIGLLANMPSAVEGQPSGAVVRGVKGTGKFLAKVTGGIWQGGTNVLGGLYKGIYGGTGAAIGGLGKGAGKLGKPLLIGGGLAAAGAGIGAGLIGASGWYAGGKLISMITKTGGYLTDKLDTNKRKRFFDVYRKDKIELGKPLLSASKQRAGVVFEDGKPVKRSDSIDRPVIDPDTGDTLITQEDIDAGLVDVFGNAAGKSMAHPIGKGIGGLFSGLGKGLWAFGEGHAAIFKILNTVVQGGKGLVSGLWNKFVSNKTPEDDPLLQSVRNIEALLKERLRKPKQTKYWEDEESYYDTMGEGAKGNKLPAGPSRDKDSANATTNNLLKTIADAKDGEGGVISTMFKMWMYNKFVGTKGAPGLLMKWFGKGSKIGGWAGKVFGKGSKFGKAMGLAGKGLKGLGKLALGGLSMLKSAATATLFGNPVVLPALIGAAGGYSIYKFGVEKWMDAREERKETERSLIQGRINMLKTVIVEGKEKGIPPKEFYAIFNPFNTDIKEVDKTLGDDKKYNEIKQKYNKLLLEHNVIGSEMLAVDKRYLSEEDGADYDRQRHMQIMAKVNIPETYIKQYQSLGTVNEKVFENIMNRHGFDKNGKALGETHKALADVQKKTWALDVDKYKVFTDDDAASTASAKLFNQELEMLEQMNVSHEDMRMFIDVGAQGNHAKMFTDIANRYGHDRVSAHKMLRDPSAAWRKDYNNETSWAGALTQSVTGQVKDAMAAAGKTAVKQQLGDTIAKMDPDLRENMIIMSKSMVQMLDVMSKVAGNTDNLTGMKTEMEKVAKNSETGGVTQVNMNNVQQGSTKSPSGSAIDVAKEV